MHRKMQSAVDLGCGKPLLQGDHWSADQHDLCVLIGRRRLGAAEANGQAGEGTASKLRRRSDAEYRRLAA
jgi:hypothetical protein